VQGDDERNRGYEGAIISSTPAAGQAAFSAVACGFVETSTDTLDSGRRGA
jgi:hypothetical protein